MLTGLRRIAIWAIECRGCHSVVVSISPNLERAGISPSALFLFQGGVSGLRLHGFLPWV